MDANEFSLVILFDFFNVSLRICGHLLYECCMNIPFRVIKAQELRLQMSDKLTLVPDRFVENQNLALRTYNLSLKQF